MSIIDKKDEANQLDEIKEGNENYEEDEEEDANKLISDLQSKIVLLENSNKELKNKLESITRKQTLNSGLLMKMAAVGLKKKFTFKSDVSKLQNDSVKLAEIMKEKDDLQQINEKMLDMLTEKELENDELNEKFENYKLEVKMENEKNMEQIKALEEKIEALENSRDENNLDEVLLEYDNQKEKYKQQINTYTKLEQELNDQLEEKDNKIKKLNEEIQNLQFENLSLLNKSDMQDKINEEGFKDLQKLAEENNKLKSELDTSKDEIKKKIKEIKSLEEEKNEQIEKKMEEIDKLNRCIDARNNDIKKLNDSNSKLVTNNKEINFVLSNKEKELNEEKEKNYKIQTKLDKNKEELKKLNDYYKTLKTNNENLLTQYQEKIDEMTKDKENLIMQNKELLEKIKAKKEEEENTGTNLGDILGEEEEKEKEENKEKAEEEKPNVNNKEKEELAFYKNENKLLNEEIKGLKEQVSSQAHDLVELNMLEKNIAKLKGENEELINNNKELKNELEKEKENQKKLKETLAKKPKEDNTGFKKIGAFHRVQTISRKGVVKTTNIEKDKLLLQKQIDMLKKLKEDEKKDYDAQIDKIKIDMEAIKVKFWNKQYEEDVLLMKYKNTIKAIANQCKLKGIKLSINMANI